MAEAALADTLAGVAACGADRLFVALDGEPGPWLPPGFSVFRQGHGPFDRRLAHAWSVAGGPGVQIGMDTPQVTAADLDDSLAALDGVGAVLGHAVDGGWWAIGLRRPHPNVFLGVPMSREDTGRRQEARLRTLGLDVRLLPELVDVDRVEDLAEVVRVAPQSRTADVARRLGLLEVEAVAPVTVLDLGPADVLLRADSGEVLTLETGRWHEEATAEEQELLAAVAGPVLDVGCGPGRLVVALARRGVPALGIDSSPFAVATAVDRGAAVLQRDVFGPLPGECRWATVLLFDGNVGIGGDPVKLLARRRQLVWKTGRVVVEVGPPGTGHRRLRARLERDGERSATFPWSLVGADAIAGLAAAAGLVVESIEPTPSGRWFALTRGSCTNGASKAHLRDFE